MRRVNLFLMFAASVLTLGIYPGWRMVVMSEASFFGLSSQKPFPGASLACSVLSAWITAGLLSKRLSVGAVVLAVLIAEAVLILRFRASRKPFDTRMRFSAIWVAQSARVLYLALLFSVISAWLPLLYFSWASGFVASHDSFIRTYLIVLRTSRDLSSFSPPLLIAWLAYAVLASIGLRVDLARSRQVPFFGGVLGGCADLLATATFRSFWIQGLINYRKLGESH